LIELKVGETPTLHPQTKLIPESDLYRLTLKSQLDSAERFQDWISEEVLPSIRKTGAYHIGQTQTEVELRARISEWETWAKEVTIRYNELSRQLLQARQDILALEAHNQQLLALPNPEPTFLSTENPPAWLDFEDITRVIYDKVERASTAVKEGTFKRIMKKAKCRMRECQTWGNSRTEYYVEDVKRIIGTPIDTNKYRRGALGGKLTRVK
jgi:hypothetical protein